MKELLSEGKELLRKKEYCIAVVVTAVLSYGYLWTHSSMGVDDTCVAKYFADGFAPTQGRWTLFLLNKVFHIAEYSPFVIDVIGVAFLAAAAVIFCILFQRLSQGHLHPFACITFSCVFLSYPLIAEVYVYYLHNGLSLAYMLSALALYVVFARTGFKRLAAAGIMLAVAFSCYESLAMVYILGIFCCILLKYIKFGKIKTNETRAGCLTFGQLIREILISCVPILIALVVRSLVSGAIMAILGEQGTIEHSLLSSLREIFGGDFLGKIRDMATVFGRYYVVNALASFPIALYWCCVLVLLVFMAVQIVKNRNGMLALATLGVLISPWLLSLVEMTAEPYRTMQTLAVFCGFVLMLLVNAMFSAANRKVFRLAAIALLLIIVYNQIFLLNKWFYVDYLKYEEDVDRASKIAYDIEKYATLDKPVVFVGEVQESGVVRTYAYLESDSAAFERISWAYRLLGMDEPEEYSTEQNLVWYSIFDWGVDAFDEPGTELIHFFRYHGYPLKQADSLMQEQAAEIAEEMSVWPKEGSILETEEYVIVKLGDEQS